MPERPPPQRDVLPVPDITPAGHTTYDAKECRHLQLYRQWRFRSRAPRARNHLRLHPVSTMPGSSWA